MDGGGDVIEDDDAESYTKATSKPMAKLRSKGGKTNKEGGGGAGKCRE